MFGRATSRAKSFGEYTSTIGKVLATGADELSRTRKELLDKADEIDRGELHVSDLWVVLIKSAPMPAEKVAQLMQRVAIEQAEINRLLLAVGHADDSTAESLCNAAKPFGFVPPATTGLASVMVPGSQKPEDEVPNPSNPMGMFQQSVSRGEDMATSVRDTKEGYDSEGHRTRTITMQDGSTHQFTKFDYNYAYGVPDMTIDDYRDANGNSITYTSTTRTPNGSVSTLINFPNGTQFVGEQSPDGKVSGYFNLPDGGRAILPPNNPFFTGSAPTRIGATFTAIDAHVGRGGGIPGVSMEAAERIGAGAKFAGPALGLLTTIYNMGAADTEYDRCIAGFAGTFGVVGDYGGGVIGATVGGAIPGVDVVAAPALAVGGAYYGSKWMSMLGSKIGVPFCK